jgi:PhzF family phenazine biosynthesis protein
MSNRGENMRLYQVDAFTNQVFHGNPAGVCILANENIKNRQLLQNIAAEMNLSETAFLSKVDTEYNLRWFTPTTEVSLCGHATLSAAHILWERGFEENNKTIIFNTLSGKLPVRRSLDKIELDFPCYEVDSLPAQPKINAAIGVNPVFIGSDKKEYLIEVEDPEILQQIQPNFAKLKELGNTAFMVTCRSENTEYDFYSRFFAPAVGIDEDPVTGSSHSRLAPYWGRKLGKSIMKAYQLSRRGGILECELSTSGRVLIRGSARTVFEIDMLED